MVYYLDSSAWVKQYWLEAGSSAVNRLFSEGLAMGSCELGPVELTSVFARKRLSGAIQETEFTDFQARMKEDWAKFERVTLSESVMDVAVQFAALYGLRGADSVHLASALQLALAQMDKNTRTVFVSSDRDLNDSAKLVGFEVIDPQESENQANP